MCEAFGVSLWVLLGGGALTDPAARVLGACGALSVGVDSVLSFITFHSFWLFLVFGKSSQWSPVPGAGQIPAELLVRPSPSHSDPERLSRQASSPFLCLKARCRSVYAYKVFRCVSRIPLTHWTGGCCLPLPGDLRAAREREQPFVHVRSAVTSLSGLTDPRSATDPRWVTADLNCF